MIGFISTFYYTLFLNHIYIQATQRSRLLHTFQFTVAHALRFSIFPLVVSWHWLSTQKLSLQNPESHTPIITHKQSTQLIRSGLLQLQTSRGCLSPRSNCKRSSVSPINPRSNTQKPTVLLTLHPHPSHVFTADA
jgi:hypothetical protein